MSFFRRLSSVNSTRSTAASGVDVYESERAVDEYLQFHFGSAEDILPFEGPASALGFPGRCAALCSEATDASPGGGQRALDVGCAVGGSSFELSRRFDEVVGIDFSQRFVDAASSLGASGSLSYRSLVEGEICVTRAATLPPGTRPRCATFCRGDACDLPTSLGKFDAVLASNLLCRLPKPRAFLAALPRLVSSGGVAVIVSPYSWLEEYTPREEWLGGRVADGEGDGAPRSGSGAYGGSVGGGYGGGSVGSSGGSFEALKSIMEAQDFVMERRVAMPFLIREHARKYQWGVSDGTVWRRK